MLCVQPNFAGWLQVSGSQRCTPGQDRLKATLRGLHRAMHVQCAAMAAARVQVLMGRCFDAVSPGALATLLVG